MQPLLRHRALQLQLGKRNHLLQVQGGAKFCLTKRGAAAQKFLDELSQRPAAEVKVGDLVWFDMHWFKCCSKVTEITQVGDRIAIRGIRAKTGEQVGIQAFPDTPMQMGQTAEEKAANREKALAYQATLTKAGKPRAEKRG